MKTTLLAIALAVASVPLTFAQVKAAPAAAGSPSAVTKTNIQKSTAKHSRKGSRKSTAKKSVASVAPVKK
jgi:hypothetical protein